MVSTGISEFSFGFAFLHEQTRRQWGNIRAMPILPSLQQEADLGWDAHLPTNGTDYYYQFKLSEYLYRSHARHIRDGTFQGPYYRIWLHKHNSNNQHRMLKRLSQTCPNTYYVSPELNTRDSFDREFIGERMTEHSRMILLADCPDIDDDEQHCICYQQGQDAFCFFSSKGLSGKSYPGRDMGGFYRKTHGKLHTVNKEYALEVFHKTVNTISAVSNMRVEGLDTERETTGSILTQASRLLSIYFGVTLVIVGNAE